MEFKEAAQLNKSASKETRKQGNVEGETPKFNMLNIEYTLISASA